MDLDVDLALSAAKLSQDMSLPMADSVILATARAYEATLLTHPNLPPWLKFPLSQPPPPALPLFLVPPVAGPCTALRPCRLNTAGLPSRSDELHPHKPVLRTVSLRLRSTDPFGLSPEKVTSFSALAPIDLGPTRSLA